MADNLSRWKKFIFALLIVLIFFGVPELVLRLRDWGFYYNFSADILGMPLVDLTRFRRIANRTVEFDREVFWKFKPNQILDKKGIYRKPVRINNYGFRGKDFQIAKPAGRFRIICLGDSVTFGWSVGDDETYPFQLEKILKKEYPHCDIEIINLGITGYTSFQGKNLFLKFGKKLKPDVVIFAFGPNDRYPALLSDKEHYLYHTWEKSKIDIFLSRLQIYKLLKSGVIYLMRRAQGLSLNPKTFFPKLKRKVSAEEYERNFATIWQECQKIGCELVLLNVDFPSLPKDPVQKSLKELAEKTGAELSSQFKKEWDLIESNQKLARTYNVPFIDLRKLFLKHLEKMAQKRKLKINPSQPLSQELWQYLMIDNGHPNERGHFLIAREIARVLEESKKFQELLEKCQKKR